MGDITYITTDLWERKTVPKIMIYT